MKNIFKFFAIFCICISTTAYSQTNNLPKTFLWKISGNGLSSPSYLYGTIHITDKRAFYFGDSLYAALENSNGYASEVDMDSLLTYVANNIFKTEKSKLIKDVLDKETYKKVQKRLSKKLNKPANEITVSDIKQEMNKTIRESINKGEMSGFMDAYLNSIAKNMGKWTGGIEDVSDQTSLLEDDENYLDPEYILQNTTENETSFLEQMIDEYANEDLQAISNRYNLLSELFTDKFINKRNIKMAYRIDSLAHKRSIFFTVGVAHLPGNNGVINLLKQKGFLVEPVFSSKKIAPENYHYKKVENNWVTNYGEDSSFTFKTPQKAIVVPTNGMPMELYMYADLGNITTINVFCVKTPKKITNADSLYDALLSSIKKRTRGEITDKKTISLKNMQGIEALLFSEDEKLNFRFQIFAHNKCAYLLQYGKRKKEDCYSTEAEQFFTSLNIYDKQTSKKKITTITDTNFLFTIKMPGNELTDYPITSFTSTDNENWSTLHKAFVEPDNSILYIFYARETKPGFYITSDTLAFNNVIQRIGENEKIINDKNYFTSFKNNKALIIDGSLAETEFKYKYLHLVNNNREFGLLGFYDGDDTFKVKDFFNSFEFINAPTENWQQRTVNGIFSAFSPNKFVDDDSVKHTTFSTYDKSTTSSFNVSFETFSKYRFWDSDTAMMSEFIKNATTEGDSLISKKIQTSENNITVDYVLATPCGYNFKTYKAIISSDTIYTLYCITPKPHFTNKNNIAFINSFKILNSPTTPVTVLNNKAEQIFADLNSKDSATKEQAIEGYYQNTFGKKHLPLLHKVLFTKYSDSVYFNTPAYYAENALVNLADSSTVALIKQNYPLADKDYSANKVDLLNILFSMKTDYAKQTAQQILLTNPPTKGNIENLSYYINADSGRNIKFIMQMLPYTKDSSWAYTLSNAVSELIDSNYISKKELLPYEKNFIKDAERRYSIIKATKDSLDIPVSYFNILQVLKSYNSVASNAVIQKFSTVKQLFIVETSVVALLINKQPVNTSAILKLAATNEFRTYIYDELKKHKKLNLFPKQYLTQKLFAKSYILNTLEEGDYESASFKFLKEKKVLYKGNLKKFYLFEVSFGVDGEKFLAIGGAFNLLSSNVELENDNICGVMFDEQLNDENEEELFKTYMKTFDVESDNVKEED